MSPPATERMLSLPSGQIHVHLLGPSSPRYPVILALHELGFSSTSLWPVLTASRAAQRSRVIMVDLPGHGGSPFGSLAAMSMPGLAKTLCEVLEALDVASATVLGHGFGGLLVLINPVSRPTPPTSSDLVKSAAEVLSSGLTPVADHLISLLPLSSLTAQPLIPAFIYTSITSTIPRAYAALLRATADSKLEYSLITAGVRLLVAAEDEQCQAAGREIVGQIAAKAMVSEVWGNRTNIFTEFQVMGDLLGMFIGSLGGPSDI